MLSLFFQSIYFTLAIFLAFYIPGSLIIKKLNLSLFQRSVLAFPVGMVLWGWQGFILGYLNIRWFSYIYLVIMFIFWIKELRIEKKRINFNLKIEKIDVLIALIIVFGVLIQISSVFFTGILSKEGLYFCCGNISDNLFHIALTNQLVSQFPPFEPGAVGIIVHNYHYWSNLVTADLIRVFKLPLIPTQFQFLTLFISIFFGLSGIVFAQTMKLSKKFIAWLLFFFYFSGDFLYLLLLFLGKGLSFKMGSLENSAIFLDNLPRAFSIVVFLAGLSLFIEWNRKRDIQTGVLMALVFGSLIAFKIYTGLFVISALAFMAIYYVFSKRFLQLIPIILTFILSALIYLPVNSSSGGLYFIGLGLFENFIVNSNLGLVKLQLALQIYKDHSSVFRVIEYELFFFIAYCFGTFGTKLLALFQTRKSLSNLPKELNLFLIFGITVSAIAGFFFQQVSGGANTFNFLVSVYIISSIYSALACYYLTEKFKKPFGYIFIIIVIIVTIPHVIFQFSDNIRLLQAGEGFKISRDQIKGFNFLNSHSLVNSIFLVGPNGFSQIDGTPYLSFLLKNKSYISGEQILESHGVDIRKREKVRKLIFNDPNPTDVAMNLLNANINYILITPKDSLAATQSAYFITSIFKNKDIKILEVDNKKAESYLRVINKNENL